MLDLVQTWKLFADLERGVGGPDSQIPTVSTAIVRATKDPAERAWMAGCFLAPYTVAGGAAIWGTWPRDLAILEPDAVCDWLKKNWEGIPIRRERRAVWKAEKMTTSLLSYGEWARDQLPFLEATGCTYEEAFKDINQHVKFCGRYGAMKVLEVLHRTGVLECSQDSICPYGAWSPRKTLSMMYDPDHLYKSDRAEYIEEAVGFSEWAKQLIGPETWFTTETLLCNYRQCLKGRYPGQSHDSELARFNKAAAHFGEDYLLRNVDFFEIRRELFPPEILGEVQGWDGPRKPLDVPVEERGYIWSDMLYDYNLTEQFSTLDDPIERG